MSFVNITCWYDGADLGVNYTIARDEYSCEHFASCTCPPLEADPDIAGIGVTVAFAISASLTLLSTIACLLLHRSNDAYTLNPIDRVMRGVFCERIRRKLLPEQADMWSDILRDMVQCLSDQQLVTGIAILVTALKLFAESTITVYHFSIALDLVWFSSNTHLLSLAILRSYGESVKPFRMEPSAPSDKCRTRDPKQQLRYATLLRAILMDIMAVLLLYANWIAGFAGWYDTFECPARCTTSYAKGGEPLQWMITNFALILYEYPLALFLLWRTGRNYWMSHIRSAFIDKKGLKPACDHAQQSENPARRSKLRFLKSIILMTWYTFSSETVEVLVQIAWHAIGYWSLFADRAFGQTIMSREERADENDLTIGQLVPLLLLLLLFIQFCESYAEHSSRNHKR
ncbi:hypothetical protein F5Y15DRAFT_357036 [Xylariaceae sp. FL0016]|nr:hypothetical protein F5Y15DRAFT_357036 [Xylariaceae sp. FL0016]